MLHLTVDRLRSLLYHFLTFLSHCVESLHYNFVHTYYLSITWLASFLFLEKHVLPFTLLLKAVGEAVASVAFVHVYYQCKCLLNVIYQLFDKLNMCFSCYVSPVCLDLHSMGDPSHMHIWHIWTHYDECLFVYEAAKWGFIMWKYSPFTQVQNSRE